MEAEIRPTHARKFHNISRTFLGHYSDDSTYGDYDSNIQRTGEQKVAR